MSRVQKRSRREEEVEDFNVNSSAERVAKSPRGENNHGSSRKSTNFDNDPDSERSDQQGNHSSRSNSNKERTIPLKYDDGEEKKRKKHSREKTGKKEKRKEKEEDARKDRKARKKEKKSRKDKKHSKKSKSRKHGKDSVRERDSDRFYSDGKKERKEKREKKDQNEGRKTDAKENEDDKKSSSRKRPLERNDLDDSSSVVSSNDSSSSSSSSSTGSSDRDSESDSSDTDRSGAHARRREKKRRRFAESQSKSKSRSQSQRASQPSVAVNQNEYGKYGIIKEEHFFQKQREFEAYMAEVKKMPEIMAQGKREVMQAFKSYMEDYNTATMPHEKYYNLEKWELQQYHAKRVAEATERQNRVLAQSQEGVQDEFNDEEIHKRLKRQEKAAEEEREFQKIRAQMAQNTSLQQNMKRQAQLNTELQLAFKKGDWATVRRLERILAPEDPRLA